SAPQWGVVVSGLRLHCSRMSARRLYENVRTALAIVRPGNDAVGWRRCLFDNDAWISGRYGWPRFTKTVEINLPRLLFRTVLVMPHPAGSSLPRKCATVCAG